MSGLKLLENFNLLNIIFNKSEASDSNSLNLKNSLETFNYRMAQQAKAERFRACEEYMSTKPINNASSISYWREQFEKTYPL